MEENNCYNCNKTVYSHVGEDLVYCSEFCKNQTQKFDKILKHLENIEINQSKIISRLDEIEYKMAKK